MVTNPTITIQADFDLDGTYETTLDTVQGAVTINRGLDRMGRYQASQLSLELLNTDAVYTPENPSSTLAGYVRPHVPLRVTASHLGTSYTLWTGFIIEVKARYDRGRLPRVSIRCQDLYTYMLDFAPTNILTDERTVDEALVAIDDAMGLTSADRDYDVGEETMPYHFARLQTAVDARLAAVNSEMNGRYFIRADGVQRFENRRSRRGRTQFDRYLRKLAPKRSYRFDEPSGTVGYDYGSDGANLTYVNTPTFGQTSGISTDDTGAALFTRASSEYATASDPGVTSVDGCFAVLVNFTTIDVDGTARQCLFDTAPSDFGAVRIIQWFNQLYYSFGADGFAAFYSGTTLTAGTWYLLGVQWASGVASLAVNGELVASYTYADPPDSTTLEIGRLNGSDYLNGTLSRFAYFDRALTAAEWAELYRLVNAYDWGDGNNVLPIDLDYEINTDDLVSSVQVRPVIFQEGQTEQEVFVFSRGMHTNGGADSLSLTTGEVYTVDLNYDAPVAALTTPVATTDYRANSAIDGSGTDRTSSLGVTVTDQGAGFRLTLVNNHASTIYVTAFRLRGTPVVFAADRPVYTAEKAVLGQKAKAGAALDLPFAVDGDNPRDYCYSTMRTYRVPYPRVDLTFQWNHDDTIADMLALELSDLVRFKDTALGVSGAYLNERWYVEAVRHRLAVGQLGQTEVTLIPSYLYRDLARVAYDLFDRANLSNDLGQSTSLDTWASDSNWNLTSGTARPATNNPGVPTLDLGTFAVDQLIEVSLAGL